MSDDYDTLVAGGGFFGLYLANFLAGRGLKVLLCEQESGFMQRASYRNQARVHNGYHYPRNILTAWRSHVSFPRFVDEFRDCVDSTFENYYLVGRILGKLNARQFEEFCRRVGLSCCPASSRITRLVNPRLIEAAFETEEFVFNAERLKQVMLAKIAQTGVVSRCGMIVHSVRPAHQGLAVAVASVERPDQRELVQVRQVFNCTYSLLNRIIRASGLAAIPLKHEMTEMALVRVPEELARAGVTVMCGPFFSLMPFPARGLHTLSHVRYTPHFEWRDGPDRPGADPRAVPLPDKSAARRMLLDAQRYLPALKACTIEDSIWEVKTVLPRSEFSDSRPILFKPNLGLKGFHCVLGGKIDNVYDITAAIEEANLI